MSVEITRADRARTPCSLGTSCWHEDADPADYRLLSAWPPRPHPLIKVASISTRASCWNATETSARRRPTADDPDDGRGTAHYAEPPRRAACRHPGVSLQKGKFQFCQFVSSSSCVDRNHRGVRGIQSAHWARRDGSSVASCDAAPPHSHSDASCRLLLARFLLGDQPSPLWPQWRLKGAAICGDVACGCSTGRRALRSNAWRHRGSRHLRAWPSARLAWHFAVASLTNTTTRAVGISVRSSIDDRRAGTPPVFARRSRSTRPASGPGVNRHGGVRSHDRRSTSATAVRLVGSGSTINVDAYSPSARPHDGSNDGLGPDDRDGFRANGLVPRWARSIPTIGSGSGSDDRPRSPHGSPRLGWTPRRRVRVRPRRVPVRLPA